MKNAVRFFMFVSLVLSQTAYAANASRVDAKKLVAIQTGDYKVVTADSAFTKENLCVKDLEHTVKWAATDENPLLAIGAVRFYTDFNAGLKTDSQPYYKHHCVYRHSTQAEKSRIIDDTFTNCDNENTTTHVEITIKGSTLEYNAEQKISRAGKVVSIPSKCTLVKIEAPAKAAKK